MKHTQTKTKISLIIISFIAFVVSICGFLFACVPLKQVSAEGETTATRPPNAIEQIYIDTVLNAEIKDYAEGIFETTSYDDLEVSMSFQEKWRYYTLYVVNNKDIELSEDIITKANAQHEKYLKLEGPFFEYTKAIYEESVAFYDAVKPLESDYETITAEDEAKYKPIKENYLKFWGEGKTEEETQKNKIYASYFRVANDGTDENYTDTADKYVKNATTIIDNCLNKAHALSIAGDTMADFKTRIEALPPILEVTNEDEETLNKLKVDLKEFSDAYAVHLDEKTKETIENYQWIVDQSLNRITNESNYTMLIIVVAIIAVGFGLYLMYKYVLSPWLKNKRRKRKE